MPLKLSWLLPGRLAKSSIPDLSDLMAWKDEGITSVVNLLEEWYQGVLRDEIKAGFNVLHSPVPDFCAPSINELHKIVQWIDSEINVNRKVLVHCFAGIGRTGTVLISYLIYKGHDFKYSEGEVLKAGAAPQSEEQSRIVEEYYKRIKD